MKRTRRQQQGYVFRKGSVWYLRYYDHVLGADDQPTVQQKCRKLADATGQYRTKQAARELASEFLRPFNDGTTTPDSSMTLEQFVESCYLPHVKEHKRLSTHKGYSNMWTKHLKSRAAIRLRDIRTVEAENLMKDVARGGTLSKLSLAHIRSFLSGAFRFARRQGVLRTENPIRDVVLPKARAAVETYAYSLEEIMQMLLVIPEPAATVVATAAFTGARRGEIRGMLWENYDGQQIRVTQSIFRGHIDEPKTAKSKAPVPVIAPLATFLENHRRVVGNPTAGLIFQSPTGASLDLAWLARKVIRPALAAARLEWHGWHAFRRGLATNLYRLGVPDKTIQAVLRHSNLSTTMNVYVKSVAADATAAMRVFEGICNQHATAAKKAAHQLM